MMDMVNIYLKMKAGETGYKKKKLQVYKTKIA